MNTKSKILLITFFCFIALAAGEQTGALRCAFSQMVSGTDLDAVRKPPTSGDLISTVFVERPLTRWLPFSKFGKTVHRRTYQVRAENGEIFEHVVTTRTSMWVVGLCSTARYDEMANKPFEEGRKQYQAKR